jgi:hypothetical protein
MFPQAGALTMLACGGIEYKQGYQDAGMLKYLQDAIKWGTDYYIKCHVAPNEFYGQVLLHLYIKSCNRHSSVVCGGDYIAFIICMCSRPASYVFRRINSGLITIFMQHLKNYVCCMTLVHAFGIIKQKKF